ncbi:MAG TPA: serine protease [Terriglobales bacterium]
MSVRGVLILIITCHGLYSQNIPQPLTQVEACRNFRASVVQIDTDTMHGTGFIVSPDGWIVTALHVVADQQTLVKYGNLSVSIHGHKRGIPAEVASQLDNHTRLRDFAVLKIDGTDLPHLNLGSEVNLEDGSQIAIIGLPLSALFAVPVGSIPSFCLTGTVASQTAVPLGNLEFLHTIYFQGVSIKGISGAPIISLQSGKVVGVVSTRMTGIDSALQQIRTDFEADVIKMRAAGVEIHSRMNGIEPGPAVDRIVKVLDEQLANGLGTGTGASDIAVTLDQAKRDYERQHTTK